MPAKCLLGNNGMQTFLVTLAVVMINVGLALVFKLTVNTVFVITTVQLLAKYSQVGENTSI